MADLTAEAASIQLKAAIDNWWLSFTKRDYEQAAFLANDVAAYARTLRQATFELYEAELKRKKDEKNADTPAEGIGSNDTGESPAQGV